MTPKEPKALLSSRYSWTVGIIILFSIFLVSAAIGAEKKKTTAGTEKMTPVTEKKSQPDKKPQYGGIYRTHLNVDPRSLDPHMETWANTTIVTLNTNNNLIRFNPKMDGVELELAESIKQIDPLTYEFKIHKGVRFHNIPPVNGRELTSEDVKYSIERVSGMVGKKTDFKHSYYFDGKIKSIETPDKYTIIFKTVEPYAPFLKYLSSPWCAIVAKEVVDQYKDLKTVAIGSGPFILKEFVKGSHISLVKNPNYWKKGLPYLDGITIKFMSDPASVLSAFLADRLDGISAQHYHVSTIEKETPKTNIDRLPGTHMTILRCPPWIEGKKPLKPPFDNKKVRQAIGMAIDKKKLLKLAEGGFGTVAVGPVPPPIIYTLPVSDQVTYNPEKARKLLAEAGYPNGFSTELLTWNLPYMAAPAQVIKEMLKEVGIEVKLTLLETAQYFNRAYRFEYEMALHVMTAGNDPEEWLVPYFGPLDESTYYKWSNPEIWKLIKEQSSIMDPKKRETAIKEIQRKIMDDAPNLFLYTRTRFLARHPRVHFLKQYLLDYQPLYGESVWMEKH
ncbi:MAG: ABC transporter substrate-binding protein [Deltaproteobacteria bacterium]|nr:ABC transporter substrate-binding protein [Deltaproteobacteria bacterium]